MNVWLFFLRILSHQIFSNIFVHTVSLAHSPPSLPSFSHTPLSLTFLSVCLSLSSPSLSLSSPSLLLSSTLLLLLFQSAPSLFSSLFISPLSSAPSIPLSSLLSICLPLLRLSLSRLPLLSGSLSSFYLSISCLSLSLSSLPLSDSLSLTPSFTHIIDLISLRNLG